MPRTKDRSLISGPTHQEAEYNSNYTGRQDISNAFTSLRRNFYPTYGVTYSEKRGKKNNSKSSVIHQEAQMKPRNRSGNSSNLNLKMQGGDYTLSMAQNRMRRREYEGINNSVENIQSFYKFPNSQKYDQNIAGDTEQSFMPRQNRVDQLKKDLSHSLLIRKGLQDSDFEGSDKVNKSFALPQIGNRYQLHITNRGPRVIHRE